MRAFHAVILGAFLGIAACAPDNPQDPLEPFNRNMHALNKGLDKVILRPASRALDAVTNEEAQDSIANFADNLNEPANAANHLLQGDIDAAFKNASRFVLNSTLGAGGLADSAAYLGLMPNPTNFGQTLAKWGVAEGPYIELPVFGPNTARSTVGLAIDTLYDPFNYYLSAEELDYLTYIKVLKRINARAKYGNLFDMILYQSPDSYSATRLAYLQNQRATVEKVTEESESKTVELENFYDFE